MRTTPPIRQQGAALVIGLLLLAILTLLAITGMNTASTELTMAGNEQFRQNAFMAADTGIEQALSVLPAAPQIPLVPTVSPLAPVPGSPTDQVTTSTLYIDCDTNVPNSGVNRFARYHFEVISTGTSQRGASATNVQGAFVVQTAGGCP
jgi:type IV pilus assembly protein PilX